MSAVDLQLSLRCAACASVVPVNALAGELTCWSCERRTGLDDATWHLLLDGPLRDGPTLGPNVEQNASLQTGVGTFQRAFRAGDPVCRGCRAPLSADALRDQLRHGPSHTAHCPQCGHGVLVRAAPPSLAAAGVAALAGESAEQLQGATAKREPVPVACTSCGGSLPVDGATRAVKCTFCSATQYLPEALWISLRSIPVTSWSLVLTAEASAHRATSAAPAVADWSLLYDVIAGADGHVYGCGAGGMADSQPVEVRREMAAEALRALMSGGEPTGSVWCMSRDGALVWERTGITVSFQTRLAWAPTGHLLVAGRGHTDVLQAKDGVTVYRFGQDGPALDVGVVESLTIDVDGTIVFHAETNWLLRTDARGAPIALWGQGARKPERGAGHEDWVHGLGGHPTSMYKGCLATGWDGHLWIQSTIPYDDVCHLVAYDRAGARVRKAEVAIPFPSALLEQRPAIDARGTIYVVVHHVGAGRHVFRVGPGEKVSRAFLAPREAGGLLGSESRIATLPDGTLFAFGNHGHVRRFGPDGALQYVSPAALAADQHGI